MNECMNKWGSSSLVVCLKQESQESHCEWVVDNQLSQFSADGGMPRPGKTGLLEWTCQFRSTLPYWEGQDDTFHNDGEKYICDGRPGNFVQLMASLCRQDLIVETAITDSGNPK